VNYLITDSVGCPREGLDKAAIYSRMIKLGYPDTFVRSYYSMTYTQAFDLLLGMVLLPGEKVIIQAGVVDCVAEKIPPYQFKALLDVNEKLMAQVYPVEIRYFGQQQSTLGVNEYNSILANKTGDRFIHANAIKPEHMMHDGIHLNEAGHLVMTKIVEEALCR
jgi:hypothetical protein